MKLDAKLLDNRKRWEEKGFALPNYDRAEMIAKTKENPFWIHFGAGNIFRAFQANAVEKLLNTGVLDRGIIVAEGFDYEIIEKMYRPNGNYSILVTLKGDGTVQKKVVGSIAESCVLDSNREMEFERLLTYFSKPSLQMATFTITEKGYSLLNGAKELLFDVERDYTNGPKKAESYLGKVAALLYRRFQTGKLPIAMVSMDNCSHNGEKLYTAIHSFAQNWVERGVVEKEFLDYIEDKEKVSFPWTMIDKITPRPDQSVEALLKADGIEELAPIVTAKNTYVAPFVNAEEAEYLVIEDDFPNGRAALQQAGFLFTDKETVDLVERMKVCTCLNPLHTALAVFGCLLGYTKISEEMQDVDLVKLVERIGYQEGLPVVTDPRVINAKEFLDTVLKERIPNPFMPDTPQRIATDTSQKLAIRFGETIKKYQAAGKDMEKLQMIPLVFAGWLRYLMGVDDWGKEMALSPDPMLTTIRPHLAEINLGETNTVEPALWPILSDAKLFGVNLYEAGMAELVCNYFTELTQKEGAVRETLHKYV